MKKYQVSYVEEFYHPFRIKAFKRIMSSPVKWGNILFLAPLSVCLSVRLSVRHAFVSALASTCISFKPLVGFTNNFAQMSRRIRRCAVLMFDQGRVKVTI